MLDGRQFLGDRRDLFVQAQRLTYDKITADGVTVVHQAATVIDTAGRSVTLSNSNKLALESFLPNSEYTMSLASAG